MADELAAAGAASLEAPPSNAQQLADFVSTCAMLFLLAEEGQNPSVRTYWDSLHYISTSLSVGYANIFPVTQMGKAIGAVVQMVGPALSAKALEQPPAPQSDAVVEKLGAILEELKQLKST